MDGWYAAVDVMVIGLILDRLTLVGRLVWIVWIGVFRGTAARATKTRTAA